MITSPPDGRYSLAASGSGPPATFRDVRALVLPLHAGALTDPSGAPRGLLCCVPYPTHLAGRQPAS